MSFKRTVINGGIGQIAIRTKQLGGVEAAVGWFPGSNYEVGTPVASVAAVQELGSPANNIPPRPFFLPAMKKNANTWRRMLTAGSKAVMAGNNSPIEVMEKIAAFAAGNVRQEITTITAPALAPSTIAARVRGMANKGLVGGLDKPLMHTGVMLESLTYEVSGK